MKLSKRIGYSYSGTWGMLQKGRIGVAQLKLISKTLNVDFTSMYSPDLAKKYEKIEKELEDLKEKFEMEMEQILNEKNREIKLLKARYGELEKVIATLGSRLHPPCPHPKKCSSLNAQSYNADIIDPRRIGMKSFVRIVAR